MLSVEVPVVGGINCILNVRKNETQRDLIIYILYLLWVKEILIPGSLPVPTYSLFNLTEHLFIIIYYILLYLFFSGKLSYTLALRHVPVSPWAESLLEPPGGSWKLEIPGPHPQEILSSGVRLEKLVFNFGFFFNIKKKSSNFDWAWFGNDWWTHNKKCFSFHPRLKCNKMQHSPETVKSIMKCCMAPKAPLLSHRALARWFPASIIGTWRWHSGCVEEADRHKST